MGGFCRLRSNCGNYHASDQPHEPADRLCMPDQDGKSMTHRVVLHRSIGAWEREPMALAHLAAAHPFDGMLA